MSEALANDVANLIEQCLKKDKEIERLNNKVEELLTLYTTERNVKKDYKSIIKEVRDYLEPIELLSIKGKMKQDILKILDKGE